VLPWVAAAVAAAGIVWLALWLPGQLRQGNAPVQEDNQAREKPQPLPGPQGVPVEAWPVVSTAEVQIRRIEGPDLASVVVGQLPVDGPMEWANPGEVWVASVEPAPGDDMVPNIKWAPGQTDFPMSWPSRALEAPKE